MTDSSIFSKKVEVIGFVINKKQIKIFKYGIDLTKEVGDEAIAVCTVDFTADETRTTGAKSHIVAVPIPLNPDTN